MWLNFVIRHGALRFFFAAASSTVSKPFMCLDSPPLGIGGAKSGSANGDEASSSHSSDERFLVEVTTTPSPQANIAFRRRLRKIKQGMKRYNTQLTLMRRELKTCKTKIFEQQKQIVEYANRFDDNDKKNEETSRKFSTLLQVFTEVYSLRLSKYQRKVKLRFEMALKCDDFPFFLEQSSLLKHRT